LQMDYDNQLWPLIKRLAIDAVAEYAAGNAELSKDESFGSAFKKQESKFL